MISISLIAEPENHCQKNEFQCGTDVTECIPRPWVCDSESECSNGEDETTEACGKHLRMCLLLCGLSLCQN